jgi:hypothetical protein
VDVPYRTLRCDVSKSVTGGYKNLSAWRALRMRFIRAHENAQAKRHPVVAMSHCAPQLGERSPTSVSVFARLARLWRERSPFDKLRAPSLSRGDEAIHLKFELDRRSRRSSFAMTGSFVGFSHGLSRTGLHDSLSLRSGVTRTRAACRVGRPSAWRRRGDPR